MPRGTVNQQKDNDMKNLFGSGYQAVHLGAYRGGLFPLVYRHALPFLQHLSEAFRQNFRRFFGDDVPFPHEADIAPVSYTHLDVYKRQDLSCAVPISPPLYRLSPISV